MLRQVHKREHLTTGGTELLTGQMPSCTCLTSPGFTPDYVKKTSKFIKLCKGDMSRRPKTAKINLGRNHHVLNSRVALNDEPFRILENGSSY